jgi:hypothetical protein
MKIVCHSSYSLSGWVSIRSAPESECFLKFCASLISCWYSPCCLWKIQDCVITLGLMIVVLTRSQIDEGLNPAPIILWDLGQAAQHSEPISSTVGWGEYHHLLSRDVVRWQNINSDARKHKTMIRCGKLLFFTHSRGIFFLAFITVAYRKVLPFFLG